MKPPAHTSHSESNEGEQTGLRAQMTRELSYRTDQSQNFRDRSEGTRGLSFRSPTHTGTLSKSSSWFRSTEKQIRNGAMKTLGCCLFLVRDPPPTWPPRSLISTTPPPVCWRETCLPLQRCQQPPRRSDKMCPLGDSQDHPRLRQMV